MATPTKRKHDEPNVDETGDNVSSTSDEIEAKKQKLSSDENTKSISQPMKNLKGFKLVKILSESSDRKSMFLHGQFEGSEDQAVVLLEKKPFNEDKISSVMSSDTSLTLDLHNDVYGVYEGFPKQEVNGIKTTVIYPATERHINKYQRQEVFLVEETYEDYKNITLPYLESQKFSIQWVYNILEKKAEEERLVFEDPDPETGFVLLPDMKWDGKIKETLYLIAICHKRDIKSLRDLTKEHLPLLENLKKKCLEAVEAKYDLPASKLRLYLHYQPSYYHLHVHVTYLQFDAPGTQATKAHLLSDVIENIRLKSDYYQSKALTFVTRGSDGLLAKFKEAGKL